MRSDMRSPLRSVLRLVVALAAVLPGCGRSTPPAATADLTGHWRVVSGANPHDVELVDRGDTLLFRAGGDEAPATRTSAGVYVGRKSADEGILQFTIARESVDRITIRFVVDVGGTKQEPPAVAYERVRASPAGAGSGSSGGSGGGGAASGARPAELVGAWRMSEPGSVGDRSWATDTHLELEADGRASTWSRTEGSDDLSESEPPTRATRKAEGGELWLRADAGGGWTSVGRFTLHDGKLVLTAGNGTRKFFERR